MDGPGAVNAVRLLNTVVFVGSARNVVPPWGGAARLGDRVVRHVVRELDQNVGVYGTVEAPGVRRVGWGVRSHERLPDREA